LEIEFDQRRVVFIQD